MKISIIKESFSMFIDGVIALIKPVPSYIYMQKISGSVFEPSEIEYIKIDTNQSDWRMDASIYSGNGFNAITERQYLNRHKRRFK